MKDLKANALAGVKWTTCSAVIAMVAKIGQIVILSRFLAKEDFGLMAIALLFISFTEIFLDLGLTAAVLHKPDISRNEYSSLFWFNIFSGFILYGIIYLIAPFVGDLYKNDELPDIIRILSTIIIFSSFFRLQRTIKQKKFSFKFVALIEIIASVILFTVSYFLVIQDYGVYSLVYSTVANSLFMAIVYLFNAIVKERIVQIHFRITEIRSFLRIGFYQTGSSILDFISSQVDILIISAHYSIETLGIYSIFKQFTQRVYGFINPIITKVLTPVLSSIQHDRNEVKTRYLQVICILSFINFPIYFLMASTAPSIIHIMFGDQYVDYFWLFSLLCVYFSILSIGNPVGSLQIAVGRTDLGFVWTIYRVIANTFALIIGAQFNIYICVLVLLLVNISSIWPATKILYEKLANIDLRDFLLVMYKPMVFSFLASISFVFALLFQNYYITFLLSSLLFLVIYGLLSFRWNSVLFHKIKNLLLTFGGK